MAETKKNKGLGLQQTKGEFQITGVVTGVEKDNFYIESDFEVNNKKIKKRKISFGLKTNDNSTVYITLSGSEREQVYFTKKEETGYVSKAINWEDRFNFKDEGYKIIGTKIGLNKIKDENGKEVNENINFCEYDACKIVSEKLKDNMSVFVKGKIEYSSYKGKTYINLVPNQISLCSKPIDFEAENYIPRADFTQGIVFEKISLSEDKTEFIINGKSIGYNSITDIELFTTQKKLAENLKRNLKPYSFIEFNGEISVSQEVEETEDDGWGRPNPMKKITSPTVRKFMIMGADPDTIDKDIYSESIIEDAVAKLKADRQAKEDFADKDDNWGNSKKPKAEEDDDDDDFNWD